MLTRLIEVEKGDRGQVMHFTISADLTLEDKALNAIATNELAAHRTLNGFQSLVGLFRLNVQI